MEDQGAGLGVSGVTGWEIGVSRVGLGWKGSVGAGKEREGRRQNGGEDRAGARSVGL